MRPTFWPLLAAALTACSSGELSVGRRDLPADAPSVTNRALSLPIGIENVNNSPLSEASYRALLRFVPDRTLSIDRFYFGFNLRGAGCSDAGGDSDGAGTGGVLTGSLTQIDPVAGTPTSTIATETVSACERHDEAAAEAGGNPVLAWVNVRVTLEAGTLYGFVVQNDDAEPADNYFSFHMPIADTELAGPHARNELQVSATGGILSLDPREHVAWSNDAGQSWQYGSANGQYRSFVNDDPAHPATRMPQYGFRSSDGVNLAPQPYYAYRSDCENCRVTYAAARYARSLTELGGFTASGGGVGTLTLSNETSGEQASCMPAQGYGFQTCTLASPVAVAVGDTYSVGASGSAELMRMDNPQRRMFPTVGTASGNLRAYQAEPAPGTNGKDVPSLWAGPLSANFPSLDER